MREKEGMREREIDRGEGRDSQNDRGKSVKKCGKGWVQGRLVAGCKTTQTMHW